MITISKNELAKRWDDLSQPLREALWSEYNADILWDICKKEHLSEDKTSTVAMLAGDVIMGFLLQEDFAKEIAENTEINREIAERIAAEVEKKIFRPVINEIKEIYSPPTEKENTGTDSVIKIKEEKQATRTVPLETVDSRESATRNVQIEKSPFPEKPLDKTPNQPAAPTTEETPFVIHQEERQQPVSEDKKFKGLEFPFGFFGKEERRAGSSEPIRVEVEAPGPEAKPKSFSPTRSGGILGGLPGKKSDKERVVHYSEYRTPVNPFGKPEEEIINLQNFTKREPAPAAPPAAPAAPVKPPIATESSDTAKEQGVKINNSKGPSIEGNIIDLKNL